MCATVRPVFVQATITTRTRPYEHPLWWEGSESRLFSPHAGEPLEVSTPDKNTTLVLELRQGDPPTGPEELPTSNIFVYCDALPQTDEELRARSVDFPQPPVEQSFGWWSMFQGNRFALSPREGTGSERAR